MAPYVLSHCSWDDAVLSIPLGKKTEIVNASPCRWASAKMIIENIQRPHRKADGEDEIDCRHGQTQTVEPCMNPLPIPMILSVDNGFYEQGAPRIKKAHM